jgi:L-fuconate dehydratase
MNPAPAYAVSYVELATDQPGLCGFGFTFTIGRGTEIVTAMVSELATTLIGCPLDDMADFIKVVLHDTTQDSHIRWLGPEKGVTQLAAGALLNAAWDLWARMRGVPLWRLLVELEPEELVTCLALRHLGDTLTSDEALEMLSDQRPHHAKRIEHLARHGYPGYVTSAGWLGYSDEEVTRLVHAALDEGWSAFKVKVGKSLEDDKRRVGLVRSLVGPGAPIMIDANQVWEVDEAIAWVRELAKHDVYWIEEPTSPDDILGHRAIAQGVAPVRVATGEHAHNRVMFKQLITSGAIDVCQIDACRVASVNENVPILLIAKKYDVPVCPHAGGVGLCELVQHLSIFDYVAVTGTTEGRWIEYIDHLHEMFVTPVRVKDGAYQLPNAPGFSAEMTGEALAAYSYPDGTVWTARREAASAAV